MSSAADPLPGLSVQLHKTLQGPALCDEAVLGRDIAEAMAELAFDAGLRLAGSPLALSDLEARVHPVYRSSRKAGAPCLGLTLELASPDGESTRRDFERSILEPVAVRASRRLVEEGTLEQGDLYFYSLAIAETRIGPLAIEGTASPPDLEVRPLRPLLARSRRVLADRRQGLADEAYALEQHSDRDRSQLRLAASSQSASDDDSREQDLGQTKQADAPSSDHYRVFYTSGALAKAERISRKGASRTPPVETGGLLLGRLYWCSETRSLFGVIDDVLEAAHSEGTTYSLTFTGETWARVQAVLKARQRNPLNRGEQILGQCHGHNFLPFFEGETCDGCPAQGECQLSTAYLSESDRTWCRAVFPREPWQLSHVFGLTPRRDCVSALFGQRGAVLVRRGYDVLDDDFESI
ncbi:MAG: hypothetical protein JRJ58_06205 [Deltaproteobacteria bacterium]|nr:hypothetical protein [Deltaproteobacteria bacterium]